MFDLITIGDSTIDTFLIIDDATLHCDLKKEHCQLCFNYAEKIPIKHSAQSVGGNAANVAAGAKKLGLKTAIVTELGDDINGYTIKEDLAQAGVDTRLVRCLRGRETRYAVVLNYQSERTILSYHAKRNYSLPKLPRTKWIYYTSLGASFEKLQKKLLRHLKNNPDVKLAMNPGSYQIQKGLPAIKSIIPHASLLIVNKEEAQKIAGKKKDARALCLALHKQGVETVVITDSLNGSYAFDGEACWRMPASPVKAIAKTGAGDAYTSGFLSAIILGETIPEAMRWGTVNAGSVIQKFGAQKGLLNRAQINRLLKIYKMNPVKIY
ncbi:MAG: carbohydrate kinase family protein [Patescibacteria group bacterium]